MCVCVCVGGDRINQARDRVHVWAVPTVMHISWLSAIQFRIFGSLSPRHGAASVCGWRNDLRYGG